MIRIGTLNGKVSINGCHGRLTNDQQRDEAYIFLFLGFLCLVTACIVMGANGQYSKRVETDVIFFLFGPGILLVGKGLRDLMNIEDQK